MAISFFFLIFAISSNTKLRISNVLLLPIEFLWVSTTAICFGVNDAFQISRINQIKKKAVDLAVSAFAIRDGREEVGEKNKKKNNGSARLILIRS